MPTNNPFPLNFVRKENNPELEAYLSQFGHALYMDAGDINMIFDALNYLKENINNNGANIELGETDLTAFRGDRGKTAYDHSQIASGNPHNTNKLDLELGNVDNTSDANKPISTATQAALDLKQSKLYINKITNGSVLTATTDETSILIIEIPANTFLASDIFNLNVQLSKTGTAASVVVKAKISTSPSTPSGTTGQIATVSNGNAGLFAPFIRTFTIAGGFITGLGATFSANNDYSISVAAPFSLAFNVTQTRYLHITASLNSAADSIKVLSATLKNF
jgi:hypothetical protein